MNNISHMTWCLPYDSKKAAISLYDWWILRIDNNMLMSIRNHAIREAHKVHQNSLFGKIIGHLLPCNMSKGFVARHPVGFLWNKICGPLFFSI